MRNLLSAILVLFLVSTYSLAGLAQPNASLADKLGRIERMIAEERERNGAPGVAVAIKQVGKVVQNREHGEGIGNRTDPRNRSLGERKQKAKIGVGGGLPRPADYDCGPGQQRLFHWTELSRPDGQDTI